MVRVRRPEPYTRSIVEPQPPARFLPLRNFEPFTTPDSLHPVFAHLPASTFEQRGDSALWTKLEELSYEERKAILKRVGSYLEDLASEGVLERRRELQSIGYGNEIGFDYVHSTRGRFQGKSSSTRLTG